MFHIRIAISASHWTCKKIHIGIAIKVSFSNWNIYVILELNYNFQIGKSKQFLY